MRTLALLLLGPFLLPTLGWSSAPNSALLQACQSLHPVLIYDDFPREGSRASPTTDINGDDQPELFHGEFVEKIAQLHGFTTERLAIVGRFALPDVADQLTQVLKKIESGETKYSRINFSQEMGLKLSSFKREFFSHDASVPEITRANIHSYADLIIETIADSRPDFQLRELRQIFRRLQELRIPFVTAAGNSGPDYVNLFSLMPGVISVGALNLDGSKRVTSADNSLVTEWIIGSFVSQQLPEGIDINADGKSDFAMTVLTKRPAIAILYVGKKVSDAVSEVRPEFREWARQIMELPNHTPNAALNVLPVGLYRVEDLATLPTVTAGNARLFRSLGKYVYRSPEEHAPNFFFEADTKGNIIFDPLKNGSTNQVAILAGTSFAAPAICAPRK